MDTPLDAMIQAVEYAIKRYCDEQAKLDDINVRLRNDENVHGLFSQQMVITRRAWEQQQGGLENIGKFVLANKEKIRYDDSK